MQASQREESKETPASQLVGKKRPGRPPKVSDPVIDIKHNIVKTVFISKKESTKPNDTNEPISIHSSPNKTEAQTQN